MSQGLEEAAEECHRSMLEKVDQLIAFSSSTDEPPGLLETAKEQGVKTTSFYT